MTLALTPATLKHKFCVVQDRFVCGDIHLWKSHVRGDVALILVLKNSDILIINLIGYSCCCKRPSLSRSGLHLQGRSSTAAFSCGALRTQPFGGESMCPWLRSLALPNPFL